jgi:hypothetical protein
VNEERDLEAAALAIVALTTEDSAERDQAIKSMAQRDRAPIAIGFSRDEVESLLR